jgi:hypothetical protein
MRQPELRSLLTSVVLAPLFITAVATGALYRSASECELPYPTDRNSWHGIEPLISSRAEVERLLGSPTTVLDRTFIYKYKSDKVHVLYSGLACQPTEAGEWNVPRDTVLMLKVYPQGTLLVKDLKFDRSRYIRAKETHPENWVHYVNQADGITVDAQIRGRREEVISFIYEPNRRQAKLRCQKNAKTTSRLESTNERVK